VLDLFTQEHFAEALGKLDQLERLDLTAPVAADPLTLVVRAALQIAVGDRRRAEHTCYRLIGGPAPDPKIIAAAHLLLSACAEGAGDSVAAAEHCDAALAADPGHAPARLHRARLLFRAGRTEQARAEYAEAARRLRGAPDLDVLLFGGGFDRAALIALCETSSIDRTVLP
jgi:chemotaxis protein methyltransferase CheR